MATINYTFGNLIKGDGAEKKVGRNWLMNALRASPENRDVRVHDGGEMHMCMPDASGKYSKAALCGCGRNLEQARQCDARPDYPKMDCSDPSNCINLSPANPCYGVGVSNAKRAESCRACTAYHTEGNITEWHSCTTQLNGCSQAGTMWACPNGTEVSPNGVWENGGIVWSS